MSVPTIYIYMYFSMYLFIYINIVLYYIWGFGPIAFDVSLAERSIMGTLEGEGEVGALKLIMA